MTKFGRKANVWRNIGHFGPILGAIFWGPKVAKKAKFPFTAEHWSLPVDDAELVAVLEGAEELRHDGAGLALREGDDPGEEVEELAVGAELEDEEDDGVAHEDVVQLYYVPVAVHVLQDVGLAQELECRVQGDLPHISPNHILSKYTRDRL